MDFIFRSLYIDKLSKFVAERFNIPLSVDYLNYIITLILILVLFLAILKTVKNYMTKGSYFNEKRRLKAHEKIIRKNIKILLSNKDYKAAAELYVSIDDFKEAAELYKKINNYLKAAELYGRCFVEEGPQRLKEGKDKSNAYLSGMFYEKAGEFEKAISIYIKDGYFREAALVCEKQGELTKAAELFIEAGDLEKAAELFRLGGNIKKSNEVLSKISYQKGLLKESAVLAEQAGDFIQSAEIFAEANEYEMAG